jgi:hypothetical protein
MLKLEADQPAAPVRTSPLMPRDAAFQPGR